MDFGPSQGARRRCSKRYGDDEQRTIGLKDAEIHSGIWQVRHYGTERTYGH